MSNELVTRVTDGRRVGNWVVCVCG